MSCVKVSIIAPVFNGEKSVAQFLESIIGQTMSDWELILVDDGSTDGTLDVVEKYCNKDKRIRLIQRTREPKGSVTCRNIGIEAGSGEYTMHLDSDDIVMPFALQQRTTYMDQHPEIDFATFKAESVYVMDDGNIKKAGKTWGVAPETDLLEAFLSVNYPFSVWNNIYRTKSFENYRWDENVKIYTDFSFIIPTLLGGFKHTFASDCPADYMYRIGQKHAMTSDFISGEKYDSTKYLFAKTMEQLNTMDKGDYYKKVFKAFFMLQYQRVLINGSSEQIEDYTAFLGKWYPQFGRLRIRLLSTLVSKQVHNKNGKMINALYYGMFQPTYLVKWLATR